MKEIIDIKVHANNYYIVARLLKLVLDGEAYETMRKTGKDGIWRTDLDPTILIHLFCLPNKFDGDHLIYQEL